MVEVSKEDIKKITEKFYPGNNVNMKCMDTPMGKVCMSTNVNFPLVCVVTDLDGKKRALCKTSKDSKPIEVEL